MRLGGASSSKRLGEAGEQLVLRGALGHLAGEAFAGVAGGVLHQFGLFAALGNGQFHAPPGAVGEELGDQILVLDRMGQQDQPGRFLVVVELGQERLEDLRALRRLRRCGGRNRRLPQLWLARMKKTWTQACPPSRCSAITSASATPRGLMPCVL